MATVTLGGNPISTSGDLPAVGTKAPDFTLTGGDLADVSLSKFAGKKIILNVFPSIDTPVCAASVRITLTSTNCMSRTLTCQLPIRWVR